LMKPPGVGIIIRTEAKGQGEQELFEDFEMLWDRWQTIVSDGEASIGPTLIYRDQDLLFRVIRDAYSNDITEILVDTAEGQKRALDYMQGWASRNTKVLAHMGEEPLLIAKGVDKEIEAALSDRAELPSGGHLNIQPTEALTVIDVNSGRFTSSRTQAETVRRTNLEAAQEIPRQLRLRNIGGMVIVDFIDMDSRRDQQQVLEQFQRALEDDRAKPQIGQLSDLGLVELTRRRQGQSLRELFTSGCTTCSGLGVTPTLELGYGDFRRVLSFKPKDEGRRGRGRNQQSGGVLKAVSASGGRIKPIMEDEAEEELSHLPQEILEQVPEEILEHQHAFGKSAHLDLDDEETGEDRDAHFGEEEREKAFKRGPLYREASTDFEDDESDDVEEAPAPQSRAAAFEADDDDDDDADAHTAHDAREEFAHTAVRAEVLEPEAFHEAPHHFEEAAEAPEVEEEPLPEVKMPETPFETEIDPVTGIYRLKVRPNQASMNSDMDAGTAGTAMATHPAPTNDQIIEQAAHNAADWIHRPQDDTARSVELSENAHQELVWQAPESQSHGSPTDEREE
jgi:hypothetical protein